MVPQRILQPTAIIPVVALWFSLNIGETADRNCSATQGGWLGLGHSGADAQTFQL